MSYPPASGGYDERLLANAPVATRAEKQEGYDVDLLENDAAVGRNNSTTPIEAYPSLASTHAKAEIAEYGKHTEYIAATPWWRQTKWVVALVVALIVVVAIAVGVGVGVGARHHHAIASHNATSSGATQSVPAASGSTSAPASAVTSSANGPVVGGVAPDQSNSTTNDTGSVNGHMVVVPVVTGLPIRIVGT